RFSRDWSSDVCSSDLARDTGFGMTRMDDVEAALDELGAIYDRSASNLRDAIDAYVRTGKAPTPDERAQGCFAYPELRIDYERSRSEERRVGEEWRAGA